MIRRRSIASFGAMAFLAGAGVATRSGFASAAQAGQRAAVAQARLRELETTAQGRLGVHILDTASGQEWSHRPDERFMMLSSFKLLASALLLHRVDQRQESLQRRIHYAAADLVSWSPVTEKYVGAQGMTLAQLCEATMTTSDNTAANLILASYGGPAALTAWVRRLGDTVTRLDRNEPTVNHKSADAPLDTTSPRAMAQTMHQVVLGDALSASSRQLLQQWLLGNTTGDKRLRAQLPAGWKIGEKTGTNSTDSNDIGVVWPPGRPPLVVTAYLTESRADPQARDEALAQVGAVVRDLVV